VTNYESYKGLWSSLVDRNYFEIAYALNRQFGPGGMYRDLPLYNFVDNHDQDRVVDRLRRREHLRPLHGLLFTMPGVPSIYYGSEWAIEGRRRCGPSTAPR
jgi:glycosidase